MQRNSPSCHRGQPCSPCDSAPEASREFSIVTRHTAACAKANTLNNFEQMSRGVFPIVFRTWWARRMCSLVWGIGPSVTDTTKIALEGERERESRTKSTGQYKAKKQRQRGVAGGSRGNPRHENGRECQKVVGLALAQAVRTANSGTKGGGPAERRGCRIVSPVRWAERG